MNKLLTAIFVLVGAVCLSQFFINKAEAATDKFIDVPANTTDGSVSMVIEHADAVSVPSVAFKWFLPEPADGNGPYEIRLNGFCSSGATINRAYMQIEEYQGGAWVRVSNRFANFSDPGNGFYHACQGADLVLSGIGGWEWAVQNDPPYPNMYPGHEVAIIRVQLLDQTSNGSLVKFNADVSHGKISPAELGLNASRSGAEPPGGYAFAMVGNLDDDYFYNARFKFRPSCTAFLGTPNGPTGPHDFYLHWQDADGWASYGEDMHWELWNVTVDGVTDFQVERLGPGNIMGPNSNEHVSEAVQLWPNQDYEWRWFNVNHVNVVHIWMPFSGLFAETITCPTPVPITCSVITLPGGNPAPGQTFVVNVSLNNPGGVPYSNLGAGGDGMLEAGVTTNSTGNWNATGVPNPAPDRTRAWRNLGAGANSNINNFNHAEPGWPAFDYSRVRIGGANFSFTASANDVNGNPLGIGDHNMTLRLLTRSGMAGGPWLPYDASCAITIPVRIPPAAYTCTAELIPAGPFEIGEQFALRITINNTSPNPATPAMNQTTHPVSVSTSPAGITGVDPPYTYSAGPGSTFVPGAAGDGGIYSNAPGYYTFTISVGGTVCPIPSVVIGNKSYMRTYGSDVWAGGGFTPSCTPASGSGDIYGWALANSPAVGDHRGSGAQFSVTALLSINEYFSASTRATGTGSSPPKGLTFANTGAGQPSSTYGGGFAGAGRCITDYWGTTQDTTLQNVGAFNGAAPSFPAGRHQFVNNGDLRIDTGGSDIGVPNGSQIAIFVDGDVQINDNFLFSTAARASNNDIPYVVIIARGNIYIDNDVSRIDAVLIAQPNGANGGTIHTCTRQDTYLTGVINQPTGTPNHYSECSGRQLTINGALVAQRIKFQRVFGTLASSAAREAPALNTGQGTNAAEIINYNPELYLAPSPLKRPTELFDGADRGGYDAISGLPPVL